MDVGREASFGALVGGLEVGGRSCVAECRSGRAHQRTSRYVLVCTREYSSSSADARAPPAPICMHSHCN